MTDPACKDCRFYQPSQSHSPRGYCHYNPPAHVSGRDMGYFVMVYGSDWCGRFEPKIQPNPTNVLEDYTLPRRAGPESDLISMTEHAAETLRRRWRQEDAEREAETAEDAERRAKEALERMSPLNVDPGHFSGEMQRDTVSGDVTVQILGKQSSIRVEAFVDDDGKDTFQVFPKIGEDNPPVKVMEDSDTMTLHQRLDSLAEEADNEEPEDSAMSMSEFMDWQEKKLLELLQDDREAVERYKKAFLQFIDDREKDEEARRRGPRMSDLFSPTIRIRPVVEEREEEEEPLKEREPAQTDWEADQITTHNERYAERVRNIGRLAQNAYQRKMDESAADLGVGEEPEEWEEVKVEEAWPGYQEIVDQIGEALAHARMTTTAGLPIYRHGELTTYFHGELWEFLANPENQSGSWLINFCYPDGKSGCMTWHGGRWWPMSIH